MNEQLSGVEDFDPDVALYLIVQQATEICDELWNARFQEAAFGDYSALNGESPDYENDYEEEALNQARDFVCEQLGLIKQHSLVPMMFNPDTQAWCLITGIGINKEFLGLVAQVFDPQDPTSKVTRFLGPEAYLMYTEPATMFEPVDDPELRLDLYADPFSRTSEFIAPLPLQLDPPQEYALSALQK